MVGKEGKVISRLLLFALPSSNHRRHTLVKTSQPRGPEAARLSASETFCPF